VTRSRDAVVITAASAICALGRTRHEALEAMIAGRSGVRPPSAIESSSGAAPCAGQAVDLSSAPTGEDRAERYLHQAVKDALEEAGLAGRVPSQTAVVMGTTLSGMRHWGAALRSGELASVQRVGAAAVLSNALRGLGVPCGGITVSAACASGLSSVAAGAAMLRQNLADVVLAGGYDPISEFTQGGFLSLRLVAADRPRPFDAERQGMIVGEGYAVIVLERAADALARGARPLAWLRGTGESSDGHHLTQPDPTGAGAARAMRAALEQADMQPSDIDLVIAHATGTPNNDGAEYKAYCAVLGPSLAAIPVTALKSRLGHALGAAGAVELAIGIACLERGMIAPTDTGTVDRSEFPDLDLVTVGRRPARLERSLHVSLGFGGADASAVIERRSPPMTVLQSRPRQTDSIALSGIGVVLPGITDVLSLRAEFDRTTEEPFAAGEVPAAQLESVIDTRASRRLASISRHVRAAGTRALRDAGVDPSAVAAMGAIVATEHGAVGYTADYYDELVRSGLDAGNPLLFAESVPNVASGQLTIGLGIRGPALTVIGSRIAGIAALSLALARLRDREWPAALVIAAEESHPLLRHWLRRMRFVREHDKDARYPPIGSGAIAFVLERAEDALHRRGSPSPVVVSARCEWPTAPSARTALHVAATLMQSASGTVTVPAVANRLGALERRAAGRGPSTKRPLSELHSITPFALMAAAASRVPFQRGAILCADYFGGFGMVEVAG
jgi:3-oxoacyl-[acyl-carrier-protein] synthase II